jgi:short-subunit dehydrogenase
MNELRGTTAVLTGASRGIGVHIARALAKQGVNLSLAARSESELQAVRDEMIALGVKAIATRCDVSNVDDRKNLLERTERELGPVDLLINNAGIEVVAHFESASEEDLLRTIDVNLVSAMMLTRAVLPGMLERKRGHVVNIASGAGKVGVPFGVAYATSKHGLVGMSNSLRSEFRGSPVGFSVVCPGFVSDTGMYQRWEDGGVVAPKIAGRSTPEKVAEVVISCIKKNRAEVIVNTPPIRPLVVLANIAPAITPRLMELFGYTKVFKRVADKAK